jgi:hypothetical protein
MDYSKLLQRINTAKTESKELNARMSGSDLPSGYELALDFVIGLIEEEALAE